MMKTNTKATIVILITLTAFAVACYLALINANIITLL